MRFGVLDLLNNVPPTADVLMSRELWFHIRPEHAMMALNNIRRSGARYLITSTHPHVTKNAAEPAGILGTPGGDWGYYDVNVELPPFNLRREDVVDEAEERHRQGQKRLLRVYRLNASRECN